MCYAKKDEDERYLASAFPFIVVIQSKAHKNFKSKGKASLCLYTLAFKITFRTPNLHGSWAANLLSSFAGLDRLYLYE